MLKNKKLNIVSIMFAFLIVIACAVFLSSCSGCSNRKEETQIQPSSVEKGIVIEQTLLKLEIGETKKLIVQMNDISGEVEWCSYDPNICTIDGNGTIIALFKGTTVVVATVGAYSASCDIVVVEKVLPANDFVLKISQNQVVLNANSNNNETKLDIVATYNGVEVDTNIEWESSHDSIIVSKTSESGQQVNVKALENDVFATLTATATYNEITATITCKVYVEDFAVIIPQEDSLFLYMGDTDKIIDFDLYLDGVKNEEKKENVVFSSSDETILGVDEFGKLTANGAGKAQVFLQYGTKTVSVEVVVGKVHYVKTATQFLEIGKGNETDKYIITNDIDLSEYCDSIYGIDAVCVIDTFSSVLEGNGHTIYGLNRYASHQDNGFNGIFNVITENAYLKDLRIVANFQSKGYINGLAKCNFGTIENCIFDIDLSCNNSEYSLFDLQVGKITNSIFNVDINVENNVKYYIFRNGGGTIEDTSFISPILSEVTEQVAVFGNVAQFFKESYYYESITDLKNKTAYYICNEGKGTIKIFENEANYDSSTFVVMESGVVFVNSEALEYTYTRIQPSDLENSYFAGSTIQLPIERKDEMTEKVFVIHSSGNDVTSDMYVNNQFVPLYAGDYNILYVATNGREVEATCFYVRVVENKVEFDNYSVSLQLDEKQAITIGGQKINDSQYILESIDTDIAVVENGEIRAIAEGETTIKIIDKQHNVVYRITVIVKNNIMKVGNVDDLIFALETATRDGYIVLTRDIEIPADKVKYVEKTLIDGNQKEVAYYYACVVENFEGVLDGQGYKITLHYNNIDRTISTTAKYQGNDRDTICGLFATIAEKAVVKNLYYHLDAQFIPTSMGIYGGRYGHMGGFTMNLYGKIQDCYLKADYKPTKAINSQEGMIGYMKNSVASEITAYCINVLFDMTTTVNGMRVDSGYPVRWASGTSDKHPTVVDCAVVGNDNIQEFYGDKGSHSIVVYGENNHKYHTIYNFVNGINGYNHTSKYVIRKVDNGIKSYSAWSDKWEITQSAIRLCGRKIADVKFENYQEELMSVSESNGVLSWNTTGEASVFVDGKAVASVTGGMFDVYEYLTKNNKPAGKYQIAIRKGNTAACIPYEIIYLNNDNFLAELNKVTSAQLARYKMYVLTEDIKLETWTDTNVGAFETVHYGIKRRYVFMNFYANVDAQGHALTVKVDTKTSQNYKIGAFICSNYGNWRNLEYIFNATYVQGGLHCYFADDMKTSIMQDCVFKITLTALDEFGEETIDTTATALVEYTNKAKFNNALVLFNAGKVIENPMYFASQNESGKNTLNNIVMIRNAEQLAFSKVSKTNVSYNNCYVVKDVAGLFNGSDCNFVEGAGTLSPTQMEFLNYWKDSQLIIHKDGSVSLCGKKVLYDFVYGDIYIPDDEIHHN